MKSKPIEEIKVLKLSLHGREVGHLAGFQNGRNVLSFSEDFRSDPDRPTFSLITAPYFPRSSILMASPWARNQKLHPILSNLLPEGSLRELIAQALKVHIDNEFDIFSYLGRDLPGALVAEPMAPEAVPDRILVAHDNLKAIAFKRITTENKYSLAGVQMKFSMKEKNGRFNLSTGNTLGDWIIKTPSLKHKDVPLNEYSAMTLASLAGINIPDIKLIALDHLDNLPDIQLPNEKFAFAIKRFDRDGDTRIHMEDFGQVFAKYPHDKYNHANYEQIGRTIYTYSAESLDDTRQFSRRVLVNILLANGDAHIKNWSLLYTDQKLPKLSPAYDILTTSAYIDGERHDALNLGNNKEWYKATFAHFESWARKTNIPWGLIKSSLDDTVEKARTLWPNALKNLPMNEKHKIKLREHWASLQDDFKIK